MKWHKDSHFVEALYVVFVAFCLVLLSSCAHDPKLQKKIETGVAAQPVVLSPEARGQEAEKAIAGSGLNDQEKTALEEIALTASHDLQRYRDEDAKLRLLLVKQLVNPQASDREVEAIKDRILELNKQSNKRWLSALDDARVLIGRRTNVEPRFYRAILESPVMPGEASGDSRPQAK